MLKKYKKGLLLKYSGINKLKGSDYKYYHGGYWNETLQGWVFKKNKKTELLNKGASWV